MKGGILWAALCLWLVAASSVAADSATFTRDANGNLTSRTEGGVEWTYAYNSRNQLREGRYRQRPPLGEAAIDRAY